MTRYHTTINGNIPFTPEEEAEADAMELAFLQNKLSEAKQNKFNELKNKYEIEANKTINFQGNTFHGGLHSAYMAKGKSDMIARFKAANQEVPPYVLTFNNIDHDPITLDTESLQDLSMAIGMAYEDAFQRKANIKKKINSLQTIDEINAFDVDAEWELSNGHRGE